MMRVVSEFGMRPETEKTIRALLAQAAEVLDDAGVELDEPIVEAGYQLGPAPVVPCLTGCDALLKPVKEQSVSVQRVYRIIALAEPDEVLGNKGIKRKLKREPAGPLSDRTVGRAIRILRNDLRLIHRVTRLGFRLGVETVLTDITDEEADDPSEE